MKPEFPHLQTESDWCNLFKRLDQKYHTDRNSPLHHNNRCRKCKNETKADQLTLGV